MRPLSFALAGGISLLALSSVAYADTAPIAERYATAEAYLAGKTGELVTDLDLRARFVAGGTKVLYRHGVKGQGEIALADTATGQVTELATEVALQPLRGKPRT